jgi:epoxyqueuosine reductase
MRAFPTQDTLTDAVRSRALGLGFHRVGVAPADPLTDDGARLRSWLDAGHHGDMHWLADTPEARADVTHPRVLPGAKTVIVCALSYHRGDEPSALPDGSIARYARGRDYHNFLRKRLRKLAAWIRREHGAEAAPLVDTSPILERAWARRAGVGFVGKHGCVIAPGLGSYLLLGEVVTTLALTPDAPMDERCGSCTRCLDACPTGAFVRPWVLDARRCISYLTIERAGPIPEELREGVGDRVLGCDACQEVCPFNRTAPPPREHHHRLRARPPLARALPREPRAIERGRIRGPHRRLSRGAAGSGGPRAQRRRGARQRRAQGAPPGAARGHDPRPR